MDKTTNEAIVTRVSLFIIKRKGTNQFFVGIKNNKFVMADSPIAATLFVTRADALEQVTNLDYVRTDQIKFQVVRKYIEGVTLVEI